MPKRANTPEPHPFTPIVDPLPTLPFSGRTPLEGRIPIA